MAPQVRSILTSSYRWEVKKRSGAFYEDLIKRLSRPSVFASLSHRTEWQETTHFTSDNTSLFTVVLFCGVSANATLMTSFDWHGWPPWTASKSLCERCWFRLKFLLKLVPSDLLYRKSPCIVLLTSHLVCNTLFWVKVNFYTRNHGTYSWVEIWEGGTLSY